MNSIIILSSNTVWAEDLQQQIKQVLPQINISLSEDIDNPEIIIVDEDEGILKKCASDFITQPILFLSSSKDTSKYADLVIRKPFKLQDFLQDIKNKTLFPKVRRKECLNFKEYSFFPVKKEIVSSVLNKTFKLTEKEVDILKYLYSKMPNITEKEELLANVWNYSADVTTHTVETHIYRLRQKVEQKGGSQLIITENNGYRLNI